MTNGALFPELEKPVEPEPLLFSFGEHTVTVKRRAAIRQVQIKCSCPKFNRPARHRDCPHVREVATTHNFFTVIAGELLNYTPPVGGY